MKNTAQKTFELLFTATLLFCVMSLLNFVHAEVRISSAWDSRYRTDGSPVPDSEHEIPRLEKAAVAVAAIRNATPLGSRGEAELGLGYKLFIEGTKFYLQPARFMIKSRPNEVCTPADYDKAPTYQCEEGRRYTVGCHLIFIDANFAEAGFHSIKINEPYLHFCNAVPAVGVASKDRNELLVTVQYFPVDRKAASKVSEIGSGWNRMTVLLRVKAVNGKIVVEQDDTCLGNPNKIDTVPDARKALARCSAGAKAAGYKAAQTASESPVERAIKVPVDVRPFVPTGSDPIMLKAADLDGNGQQDYVLVTEERASREEGESAGGRTLWILVRGPDGRLMLAKSNASAIYSADMGGMMGDPFVGVSASTRSFEIEHYGGSAWRWSTSSRFNYSKRDNTWQLVRVQNESFHAPDANDSEVTVETPPKHFGKIDIADFDPERYLGVGTR